MSYCPECGNLPENCNCVLPCEYCGEDHCICEGTPVEYYDSLTDSWEYYDVPAAD